MSPTLAFGDDRSPGAEVCWEWIVDQRWEGWRLEVITAGEPADLRPPSPEEAALHPWEPEAPRRPGERGFAAVEHLRAEVDPRVALIARRWDLVAVGVRGGGLLKKLGIGSTTDWLLRQPTSPLVIARRPGRVRRVLVATDGSAHAGRAIDTLTSLPWIGEVEVAVLAVDDETTGRDGTIDRDGALAGALAGAARTLSARGLRFETVARGGSATPVIVEEIESREPDLVVMGARGRGGIGRLVLGSTTAAVTAACDRSILVAHAASGT